MQKIIFGLVIGLNFLVTPIWAEPGNHKGTNPGTSRSSSRPIVQEKSKPTFYIAYGKRSVEDVLYNYVAFRQKESKSGKEVYASSTAFLYASEAMQKRFEKQVVDKMAADGFVVLSKLGPFQIMVERAQAEQLKGKAFCMVYSESSPATPRSFDCSNGGSLNSDLTKKESAAAVMKRNGFSKVADFSHASEIRTKEPSITLYIKD